LYGTDDFLDVLDVLLLLICDHDVLVLDFDVELGLYGVLSVDIDIVWPGEFVTWELISILRFPSFIPSHHGGDDGFQEGSDVCGSTVCVGQKRETVLVYSAILDDGSGYCFFAESRFAATRRAAPLYGVEVEEFGDAEKSVRILVELNHFGPSFHPSFLERLLPLVFDDILGNAVENDDF